MSASTSTPAIKVVGIDKIYDIAPQAGSGQLYDTVAGLVGKLPGRQLRGRERKRVWALRDVSFEVPRGEVMGVIGRNGSGKSTLMRILSRVTFPTRGHAEILGRVGALLQVGAGFHPELSGRDNIALSGAILGMSRSEIRALEDQIIDFSEIEDFIDTPVKLYSSGMYLRLAFSVSSHLAAEVMLVDEVLAVGDLAFQEKCRERIRTIVGQGRTVMLVTHSMMSVTETCQKAMVLDAGRVQFVGEAEQAISFYEDMVGVHKGE